MPQHRFSNSMESALGVLRTHRNPAPLLSLAGTGLGQYPTLQEVEEAVKKDYSTSRSSRYIVLNDENPAEVGEMEAEIQHKAEQRERRHERTVNPVDSTLMSTERKASSIKSRKIRVANDNSPRKASRPRIEFVDVPGRRPENPLGKGGQASKQRSRSERV